VLVGIDIGPIETDDKIVARPQWSTRQGGVMTESLTLTSFDDDERRARRLADRESGRLSLVPSDLRDRAHFLIAVRSRITGDRRAR
jgi:hypothetical protein